MCVSMHRLVNLVSILQWKMWSIPNGELILTGEGHKSWVSCVDFHPMAANLATSSGDGTVKVNRTTCVLIRTISHFLVDFDAETANSGTGKPVNFSGDNSVWIADTK